MLRILLSVLIAMGVGLFIVGCEDRGMDEETTESPGIESPTTETPAERDESDAARRNADLEREMNR